MSLNFKKILGTGKRDLIILHGLFGSHKNWLTVANALQPFAGNIYLPDARNHGDSPHYDSHTLADLTDDLNSFILEHNIAQPIIMGHSMGGLTAMNFALEFPEIKLDLVVVDIFPKEYEFRYQNEIKVLNTDLALFKSRQEIDKAVSHLVPDPFVRQFLLMNLERKGEVYFWKINAKILNGKFQFIPGKNGAKKRSMANVLFIMGEDSEYYDADSEEVIRDYFPLAEVITIPGGNHYIHFSKFNEFMEMLKNHLEKIC